MQSIRSVSMSPGDGEVLQSNIYGLDDYDVRLSKAQTVAFISLVWSENIRAYISRSFTAPMWHDVLGNKHMQKAIVMAQICLYVAVLPLASSANVITPIMQT